MLPPEPRTALPVVPTGPPGQAPGQAPGLPAWADPGRAPDDPDAEWPHPALVQPAAAHGLDVDAADVFDSVADGLGPEQAGHQRVSDGPGGPRLAAGRGAVGPALAFAGVVAALTLAGSACPAAAAAGGAAAVLTVLVRRIGGTRAVLAVAATAVASAVAASDRAALAVVFAALGAAVAACLAAGRQPP